MSDNNKGHSLRDPNTGVIRKDIRVIHVRILNDTLQQEEANKLVQKLEDALKSTGNEPQYVVLVTPPNVIIDVDWVQPYLKKLEDTAALLKDAEFTEQLRRVVESARQKRWNIQNPQPGQMY